MSALHSAAARLAWAGALHGRLCGATCATLDADVVGVVGRMMAAWAARHRSDRADHATRLRPSLLRVREGHFWRECSRCHRRSTRTRLRSPRFPSYHDFACDRCWQGMRRH